MAETVIKKVQEKYMLTCGKYNIRAIIDLGSKKITLTPESGYQTFIFERSTPETLYAIGTLIRDAADLIDTD